MSQRTVIPTIALVACVGCGHVADPSGSQQSTSVDSADGVQRTVVAATGSSNDIAGAYYRGDGTGFNLHLELLADGKYACQWTGCGGVYGNCVGVWTRIDNQIEIKTTSADGMFEENALSNLEIIPHDGGNILVPQDDRAFFDEWGPSRYSCFSRTE